MAKRTSAAVAKLHVIKADALPVRLDIGCGKCKEEGWTGLDVIDFGQELVADVRKKIPFADGSVDQARACHFVEHLTGSERVAFFNDLYRVLKVGSTAQITTPHWSHACAYGDPTHQWPPMSEWYPLYLNKTWRTTEAPHAGYTCDFDYTVAGSWDQRLNGRNPEYVQVTMNTQTNAWRDLIVTLTKRG